MQRFLCASQPCPLQSLPTLLLRLPIGLSGEGRRRNGISKESGLLKQWPAGGPKLLWQLNDIGDGYSGPSVVGTRIYLMSNRGMDNEFVQALSAQDGKVIWTTRVGNVGNPDQNPKYPKARSTPTVDGNFIYALGSDGDLACLETKSGKIRWQKSLRKDFGGQPHEWAYAESPLVDGDVVVVSPQAVRGHDRGAEQEDRRGHLEIGGSGW